MPHLQHKRMLNTSPRIQAIDREPGIAWVPHPDETECRSLLRVCAAKEMCCSPRSGEQDQKHVRCSINVAALIVQTVGFCVFFLLQHLFITMPRERELTERVADLRQMLEDGGNGTERPSLNLESREVHKAPPAAKPFQLITGMQAHQLPKMYGTVREKTIWSYWYDKHQCPSSARCILPAALKLCVETVERNRGSFDYRLLHQDEVSDFVSLYELPVRWKELTPQHQKDSLMNALLARYGGVALDISVIMLRPIDDYWDEMVRRGATFFGYLYRLNGFPWRHPESVAVWFMMSRREGVFSTAVRNQVIGMGDSSTTNGVYHHAYYALGDQTIFPILTMFNSSLPKCSDDNTLMESPSGCPEFEQSVWPRGLCGDPRNDTRIILRDPRDGPQLPFATLRMLKWDVHNKTEPLPPPPDNGMPPAALPGGPMYMEACSSMNACWNNVFLQRFHEIPTPGEARRLSFLKVFSHAKELNGMSREEILGAKRSFFHFWLKMAGLPQAQVPD